MYLKCGYILFYFCKLLFCIPSIYLFACFFICLTLLFFFVILLKINNCVDIKSDIQWCKFVLVNNKTLPCCAYMYAYSMVSI